MRFETKAIHIGEELKFKEGENCDVTVPIHLTSTYALEKLGDRGRGYDYSRSGNPTRAALERRLAALEGAKYGLAFASGMAATLSLLIAVLRSGDNIIAFDDLYGGTKRLLNAIFAPNFGITIDYVDAREIENIKKAFKPNTKLIWLESPTNPLMRLCDIRAIAKLAKERGAIVVVDNTFMTPYFQKPLELGADASLYSTTKYLNGHSDSLGGAVLVSDEQLYKRIKFSQNAGGAVLSPFDSFLVLRGLETLALRMERHNENGLKVARFLSSHPKVKKVYYVGLEKHPQYELGKSQMSGYGGMVSFEIKGGYESAKKFLESLSLFAIAVSLGGAESLIEHPVSMSHASVKKDELEKIGVSDSLIRISVGIENVEDLIEDLNRGFKAI
ncbi:MAG: PLP-dependent aspartate aminotransferase family protein [Myxococcota bacterium]